MLLPADEAARFGRGSVRARDARRLMMMMMMMEMTCSLHSRAPSLDLTVDHPPHTHTRALTNTGEIVVLVPEDDLSMLVHDQQTTVTRLRVTSLLPKHQI